MLTTVFKGAERIGSSEREVLQDFFLLHFSGILKTLMPLVLVLLAELLLAKD